MFSYRYPDKPVTATPDFIADLDRKGGWVAGKKLDGWRCGIYVDPAVKLLSSQGNLLADRVKIVDQVVPAVRNLNLPAGTVLDAEFVGPRGSHKPGLWVFDCLAWEGQWLARRTYAERLEYLVALNFQGAVHLVESVSTDFLALFDRLKQGWIDQGMSSDYLYEGIVVKRLKGTLELSRNSLTKSKCQFKLKFRDIDREQW